MNFLLLVILAIVMFLAAWLGLWLMCVIWKLIRPFLWVVALVLGVILLLGLIFSPGAFVSAGYIVMGIVLFVVAVIMIKIL